MAFAMTYNAGVCLRLAVESGAAQLQSGAKAKGQRPRAKRGGRMAIGDWGLGLSINYKKKSPAVDHGPRARLFLGYQVIRCAFDQGVPTQRLEYSCLSTPRAGAPGHNAGAIRQTPDPTPAQPHSVGSQLDVPPMVQCD
jgi:hypothetical protein